MLTPEQQRLVEQNIGLIWPHVNKYTKALAAYSSISFTQCQEEFVDLAWIGLCMAAQTYDPTIGYQFSSLAYTCIRNQLCASVHEVVIHISRNKRSWNTDRVYTINGRHDTGSHDSVVQIADRGEINTDDPNDQTKLQELKTIITLYLEPKRAKVLYLRAIEQLTFNAIATRLNVTSQRICQLWQSACYRLRHNHHFINLMNHRILNRKKHEYTRAELGNAATLPIPLTNTKV